MLRLVIHVWCPLARLAWHTLTWEVCCRLPYLPCSAMYATQTGTSRGGVLQSAGDFFRLLNWGIRAGEPRFFTYVLCSDSFRSGACRAQGGCGCACTLSRCFAVLCAAGVCAAHAVIWGSSALQRVRSA